jgi:FAD/FMN-containing dehydrogenase
MILWYHGDEPCDEIAVFERFRIRFRPPHVEEIQVIVRLANKEKVPITPYIAGG